MADDYDLSSDSNYTYETWPANPNVTLAYTLWGVASSVIGIPANFLVLVLSLFSSKVTGNCKHFIANLAFVDLTYCFTLIFQMAFYLYHRFADVPFNVTKCTIMMTIPYGIGMCLGFALPLTSINRYLVIVKKKDEWFDKKRIALLCLTSYIPIIYPIITFLFAPYVVYYPYCDYTLYFPYAIESIMTFIIVVLYPTIMFCNYGIYRALSRHANANEVTTVLNHTVTQMKNERSILKAIVIQGLVPVITALPVGVIYCGVFFFGWDSVTLVLFDFGPDLVFTTVDAALLLFMMTPTCDALIALLVMKQYREALTTVITALKRRFWRKKLTTVVPFPVENSIHSEKETSV